MMKPEAFFNELRRNGCPSYVIASGAEELLRAEARDAVLRTIGEDADLIEFDWSREAKDEEGFVRILDELSTGSLFGPGKLVLVRNARPMVMDNAKSLASFASSGAAAGALMLEDDELAGKKGKSPPKGVQALVEAGGVIVDCRPLYDRPFGFGKPEWDSDLTRFVTARAKAAGKSMSPQTAFELHSRETSGLRAIVAQLEKLVLHVGDRPEITAQDVDALVGGLRDSDVFRIVDAFAACQVKEAVAGLEAVLSRGVAQASGSKSFDSMEIAMRLVSTLARRLRELGAIAEAMRSGSSYDDAAADVLGRGRKWLFPKIRAQLDARRVRGLGDAVVGLARLESHLKTGGGEPEAALYEYLVRFGGPGGRAVRGTFA